MRSTSLATFFGGLAVANAATSWTTVIMPAFTTYCSAPTTWEIMNATYTVTGATTITAILPTTSPSAVDLSTVTAPGPMITETSVPLPAPAATDTGDFSVESVPYTVTGVSLTTIPVAATTIAPNTTTASDTGMISAESFPWTETTVETITTPGTETVVVPGPETPAPAGITGSPITFTTGPGPAITSTGAPLATAGARKLGSDGYMVGALAGFAAALL